VFLSERSPLIPLASRVHRGVIVVCPNGTKLRITQSSK
jgi:hypothetical protein